MLDLPAVVETIKMKINEKKTFSYFNYSFQNLIDFKLSITLVQESFLGKRSIQYCKRQQE